MNLLDIWLLAVALAMDCFTVSIVSGVILSNRSPLFSREGLGVFRLAFLFGAFQALMPLIGWFATSRFSEHLEFIDHWIAFALLAFIGGKMIKESFEEEQKSTFDPQRLHTQLLLAVATSIDALAVGISFACTGYEQLSQLWMPLAVIGMVSFLFSLLGYWAGYHFGRGIISRFKPELIGGVILILIGVRILMSHLGYI